MSKSHKNETINLSQNNIVIFRVYFSNLCEKVFKKIHIHIKMKQNNLCDFVNFFCVIKTYSHYK